MYKYILNQWKKRKMIVLLIILGFMCGSFVMSLGISASTEAWEYSEDKKMGNPDDQCDIAVSIKSGGDETDINRLMKELASAGEVQWLSSPTRRIDSLNDSAVIVPILFEREPDWNIPIAEGEYFKADNMKNRLSQIIIGRDIAKKHQVGLGDIIKIEGKEYSILAICGRQNRETSWDSCMYMPWDDYIELYPKFISPKDNLSLHLSGGKERAKECISRFQKEGKLKITYWNSTETDDSSLTNTLLLSIISTSLIFIIAIFNIIHLMLYWIMERKKIFGVILALGAKKRYISILILMESVCFAAIGCFIAFLFQFIAMHVLKKGVFGFQINFELSWINFVLATGVSVFFGILASLVPVRTVAKWKPIEIIRMRDR